MNDPADLPPIVRRGLVLLRRAYPSTVLLSVDEWQEDGVWVIVTIATPGDDPVTSRFAIWRRTGAVYSMGDDGAVSDDPILTP